MKKTVTFGEILLRLTPPGYMKFSQSRQWNASFGGSETNVAVSLAHFGLRSDFVTRVPDNEIAQACIMDLASHKVETDNIIYGGRRLGLYYYENTAWQRTAKVVYDREDSSFSTMKPGMANWIKIFENADWFHWSGIAPSVSQDAADTTIEAIEAAEKAGLTISSDLNYRKNLWKYGKEAEEVMPALAAHCDVLFGTESEYQKAFGVQPIPYKVQTADEVIDLAAHEDFCRQVMARAPKCKKMFVALRNVISSNEHILSGLLYTCEGKFYHSRTYHITPVIDCVGVGDALAAGMIYGIKNYPTDDRSALEFAVATSSLKNTITGDYNILSVADVEALMKSGSSEVQR